MFCVQSTFGQHTYSTSGTYLIDATGSHPPPPGYSNGIILKSGVTLIIENRVGSGANGNLKFNSMATIDVEPGAHLKIINSVLENNSWYFWEGIKVVGRGSIKEQYITFPTIPTLPPYCSTVDEWLGVVNNIDMGWVELYSSTITGASIGITSNEGGIIWVDGKHSTKNATFLNCIRGILIYEYHSPKCPSVNACHIMQADFIWDSDDWDNNESDNGDTNGNDDMGYNREEMMGIYLEYVSGINIGGCNFKYDIINPNVGLCKIWRGYGIKAIDSDFSVGKSGNSFCRDEEGCLNNCYINLTPPPSSRGNTFEQLSIGIVSSGSNGQRNYANKNSIRYSSFLNNLYSITSADAKSFIVNKCSFQGTRSLIDGLYDFNTLCTNLYYHGDIIYDIFINISSGVRIFDNTFTFDDRNIHNIEISNTDYINPTVNSYIKKNTFTNTYSGTFSGSDDIKAIKVIETCTNLKITCNTFNDFVNDIFIGTTGVVSEFFVIGTTHYSPENTFSIGPLAGRVQLANHSTAMSGLDVLYNIKVGGTPEASNVHKFLQSPSFTVSYPNCYVTCTELLEGLPEPSPCTTAYLKPIYSQTLKIYPNPAFNKIYLDIPFSGSDMQYSVQIINLEGKIVKEILIKDLGENNSIDISNISKGLYVVKVATANYHISGRVLLK